MGSAEITLTTEGECLDVVSTYSQRSAVIDMKDSYTVQSCYYHVAKPVQLCYSQNTCLNQSGVKKVTIPFNSSFWALVPLQLNVTRHCSNLCSLTTIG